MMFFGRKLVIEPRGMTKAVDHFVVSSTAAQLSLDFILLRADGSHAGVRVRLARSFGEKACVAIEQSLAQYTTLRGHVRVSREPVPEPLRFTSLEEHAANHLKAIHSESDLFLDFRMQLIQGSQLSELDRVMVVLPVGLAPPLLAAMQATLEAQRKSDPWPLQKPG
jgi:hypothetical protein